MSERTIRTIAEGFTYLEGPRWHNGELWFVDFYTNSVNRVDAAGATQKICEVEGQPSGLGWLPDGRMLVVSMKDKRVLRMEEDGVLVEHADISDLCPGHANDMVVAPNGNAYVGNFGFDLMAGADHEFTTLVLVRPNGESEIVGKDLSCPNGMVISADEQTLIVNELFGNRISAFDILDDGTLGARRDFANFGDLGGEPSVARRLELSRIVPDGLALDAEGAVWIADCVNQRALRILEGGEIVDEVSTAPNGVFAVALGGDEGRTLFMCVAPDFNSAKRSAAREAFMAAVDVEVPHAGTP